MEEAVFFLFAFLTVGGALVALVHKSVVHSAFALMATFFGIAGFYLLLGSDFLAVTQLLIYVGGILALYLFGLMLTPPDPSERKFSRIAVAVLMVGGIGILIGTKVASVAGWLTKTDLPDLTDSGENKATTVVEIGKGFLQANGQDAYLIPFELTAIVLLVALIGSVFIARRKKEAT